MSPSREFIKFGKDYKVGGGGLEAGDGGGDWTCNAADRTAVVAIKPIGRGNVAIHAEDRVPGAVTIVYNWRPEEAEVTNVA